MKTRKFCPHCGKMVTKSPLRKEGYTFQGIDCNEDFYRFEALEKTKHSK